MFQVGDRKRSRRTVEGEKPSSRRRLSVTSIGEAAPLKGAVVCLTGLPADEKTRLHQIVEQLGGSFTRDLDTAKNTHLIAKEPEGAKYDTAISCSRIRVVSPAWLNDCITTGLRADEKQYLLKITTENDEFPPLLQEIQVLLEDTGNRNSLFESCRFLLLGFQEDSQVKAKLSHLIRRGKGTIYWELNEEITHIVVADDCDETHRDAARTVSLYHPNGPAAVSPFWMVSSWKDTTLAPAASFPPRKAVAKQVSKMKAAKPSKGKRPQSNVFQGSVFALLRITPPEGSVDFDVQELEICITSNGGQLLSSELLEALRADKTSKDSQLRNCHVVCWGGYSSAHLMVHPLLSRVEKEKLCVVMPVTPVWLYASSADRKLLNPTKHPNLFQPQTWSIRHLPDSKRGKESGIKVCVTGFVGSERTGIIQALRVIGAEYTENLRNTNTHLICKESTGAKYEKAVKWGLYVVSVQWLYHIMQHGYDGKNVENKSDDGCEDKFSLVSASENSPDSMDEDEGTQKLSQTNSEGGVSLQNESESQWSQDARDMTVEETQHGWAVKR